jgi:tetratricopeptide (TPR) repeat protein
MKHDVMEARVAELTARLAGVGDDAGEEVWLRVERARLLTDLGRPLEARSDHIRVVELEPAHRENLFDLGRLLVATSQLKAAQVVYAEAVKHYPGDVACRVNLGSALLQCGDPAAAREQYEAALGLDPEFPQAHGGLYYALTQLGEYGSAAEHQQKAFGAHHIFESPYRGLGEAIPVLLLVASTGGNTPIEKLLDEHVFKTYVVVADFFDATRQRLPEHRLVVNGIGDPDVASHALESAIRLVAEVSSPVLNSPDAVLATGRCANAERLAAIPNLRTARTRAFPHHLLAGEGGAAELLEAGLSFPLLLRAPGYHMGMHFVRIERAEDLASEVAKLPGGDREGAELLAMEYLDARGADGASRKYRVMMVDGELYPLHLAISPNWKVHYFSADMKDRADHRAEELAFLEDMDGVLGPKAMGALRDLQKALGLDYGGVDFGLSLDGEVLLFEANATMVVEQPDSDSRWDYRRTAVTRIHEAVREMLLRQSGVMA